MFDQQRRHVVSVPLSCTRNAKQSSHVSKARTCGWKSRAAESGSRCEPSAAKVFQRLPGSAALSMGGIRVPLYAHGDTTTRNFCFLRTVAPQPQSLPVSVGMCRPISSLSFRFGGLLSCTDSCHGLTQYAPDGLRGKYSRVGLVFSLSLSPFCHPSINPIQNQSLRSLA
jgi:hypothetical protein